MAIAIASDAEGYRPVAPDACQRVSSELVSQGGPIELADIHEAKSNLSKLIERALQGEEIVIARAGKPEVRLVPIRADSSPRVGGRWRGRVAIAEDFDSLPRDIAEAFGMEAE